MERKKTKAAKVGQTMPKKIDAAALQTALVNLSTAKCERAEAIMAKAAALCAGPDMKLELRDDGKHRAGFHGQTFTLTRLRPGMDDAENILTIARPAT